ncbi:hypothetical protein EYF80_006412 [Liparis tanakae]|uniref:Uncharacterized protein n=1 Tax=Liparis tanakae TaxID=230148 RepID=A0A4Z2J0G7_9TELE|nr:hypothetical protein EYF80_006412 [Liparis tanakae]
MQSTWALQTLNWSTREPGWLASMITTLLAEWVLVRIHTRLFMVSVSWSSLDWADRGGNGVNTGVPTFLFSGELWLLFLPAPFSSARSGSPPPDGALAGTNSWLLALHPWFPSPERLTFLLGSFSTRGRQYTGTGTFFMRLSSFSTVAYKQEVMRASERPGVQTKAERERRISDGGLYGRLTGGGLDDVLKRRAKLADGGREEKEKKRTLPTRPEVVRVSPLRFESFSLAYLIISVHRTASCSSISLSLYWFLSISTRAISTRVKRRRCVIVMSPSCMGDENWPHTSQLLLDSGVHLGLGLPQSLQLLPQHLLIPRQLVHFGNKVVFHNVESVSVEQSADAAGGKTSKPARGNDKMGFRVQKKRL